MRNRQPVPIQWLMTDERMGDDLWPALERLPRGAGVVFRHYSLPAEERRTLFGKVEWIARRHGLVLLAAGFDGPDGAHNHRPRRGLYSRSAHDHREALAAMRAGADLIFVSPVFATRSHPGARGMGPFRFSAIARGLAVPVIALGGMDAARWRLVRQLGADGWAGIDAWLSRSPPGVR